MTDPITETLDELEAKALAATPGPWECPEQRGYASNFVYKSGGMRRQVCRTVAQSSADGAFIAAHNPSRALELIAVVRAARNVARSPGILSMQALDIALAKLGGGTP